jgi:hypothetical protein
MVAMDEEKSSSDFEKFFEGRSPLSKNEGFLSHKKKRQGTEAPQRNLTKPSSAHQPHAAQHTQETS